MSTRANEFGFELSASQAKRNEEGIAALYAAAKGDYGPEAQKKAREFFNKQEIDIGVGLKALVNKFNKGEITEEGIEEQEDEPTSGDLKKTKGLAKSAEDLARVQADMRSLAKKYSKATGQEKEDLLSQLKAKTKLKKELENILNRKL